MADFAAHRSQALHNEAAAKAFLPTYHDWAVTATLYAALHFVECWFFSRPDKATEMATLPSNISVHAARLKYVQKYMNGAYRAYSFLYQRSQEVRYLESLTTAAPGVVPAYSLVDGARAAKCVNEKLPELKTALKTELCNYLHQLNVTPRVMNAALGAYSTVAELQAATSHHLQTHLNPFAAAELIKALTAAGKPPAR